MKEETRKKKARRLACYLWHQQADGVTEAVANCKDAIIATTAQQFFEDKNWPNSETVVPPKDFKEDE